MKTLYRAASRATAAAGAHFSPSKEMALAYTTNPGFGGPRLYRYEIDPEYHLDLYKVEKRRGYRVALETLAEALEYDDPYETMLKWEGRGYYHMFHVFENDSDATRRAKANFDWISFQDDFPEGAETWRYFGDAKLEGENVSTPASQLDREIREALED
jgi:hypothetical protein